MENSGKQRGKPFPKGKSGNPNGRPKTVAEIREALRRHAPEAVKRLVQLSKSKNETVAERAASAILDRAGIRPIAAEGDKVEVVGEAGAALGRLAALLARGASPEPEASAPALPAAEPDGRGG
jgi:hypothetical protein